ncbi:MAG: hypothetical protein SH857_06840 [Chitinophagales bacterium]|nr:hypothetical protein [Chitinophagales bacterium]
MKKTLVLAGTILTALAFTGCNSEAALKEAQAKFDSQLTAVKDSLAGVAKTELDAVKATYDAQVTALTDSLAAKTAALEAAVAKKTGTTTKKVDPKTAGMDAKEKAAYEQKKAKMGGK